MLNKVIKLNDINPKIIKKSLQTESFIVDEEN